MVICCHGNRLVPTLPHTKAGLVDCMVYLLLAVSFQMSLISVCKGKTRLRKMLIKYILVWITFTCVVVTIVSLALKTSHFCLNSQLQMHINTSNKIMKLAD